MVRKQHKRINKNRAEVKQLINSKLITQSDWILIYGCRDGEDVENLLSWKYSVCGYDKHNESFNEKERYLLDIYVNKILCFDVLNGENNEEEIEEMIAFFRAYKKENPQVKIYCSAPKGRYTIDKLRDMFGSIEVEASGIRGVTLFKVN